jgi:hypothetical protein
VWNGGGEPRLLPGTSVTHPPGTSIGGCRWGELRGTLGSDDNVAAGVVRHSRQ